MRSSQLKRGQLKLGHVSKSQVSGTIGIVLNDPVPHTKDLFFVLLVSFYFISDLNLIIVNIGGLFRYDSSRTRVRLLILTVNIFFSCPILLFLVFLRFSDLFNYFLPMKTVAQFHSSPILLFPLLFLSSSFISISSTLQKTTIICVSSSILIFNQHERQE